MEKTYTHHFVDDAPVTDVDGIEPWDQAMETLRRHTMFSPSRMRVSPDGKTLTVRLMDSRFGEAYTRQAKLVIELFNLPLEAKRCQDWIDGAEDQFGSRDILIGDNLVITYRP